MPQHLIDPADPKNHDKPLWVLHGHECAPGLMCAKLLAYAEDLSLLPVGEEGPRIVIWGYSVYQGVPAFRTLGQDLSTWAEHSSYGPFFFDGQQHALDELRRITTPVGEAI
jgi:hypothetical protein